MITAHDLAPAGTLAGQTAMAAALADFERRYPAYARTAVLDDLRARDYARLDATGHVYLDYTGGGLYADSQLARHRDAAGARRVRQPALSEPALTGSHRPGGGDPGSDPGVLRGFTPRSTRSSSPRTPPARSGWSASPTRSGRAAGSC